MKKRQKEKCECDCSGIARLQVGNTIFIAIICPKCSCESSLVIFNAEDDLSFRSTRVKPSSCVSNGGGKVLIAAGEGFLTIDGQTFPTAFQIALHEDPSSPFDLAILDFFTLDENGQIGIIQNIVLLIPDQDLKICDCPGE
ncbi:MULTISPECIES: hypothetical protein [Bacillaceae]|uniref:Uncharacterized protein n=1 Tax=Domibacillus aminovorans TaxID=29332 RepID=A0A177KY27_9BACI|nr:MULTISPECIES: hypothetical protein [Bacillaceae]OAH57905.1 hypothetical protein AWH48_02545 [Domibacillus aminovorans]